MDFSVDASSKTFDYIVIGGGTAGLVVASRLAEITDINVGVIEAGQHISDDSRINIPGLIGMALADPKITRTMQTVPQTAIGNRVIPVYGGNVLGGSSAINFLASGRGDAGDYDAWGKLGNSGWSWNDLLPYFKKSESVSELSPEQGNSFQERDRVECVNTNVYGTEGPLKKSHSAWHSDSIGPFMNGLNDLGIKNNKDPDAGSHLGVSSTLLTIDPTTLERSYSASVYYRQDTSNLEVLTSTTATQIILQSDGQEYLATGVKCVKGDGTYFTVHARKEVILAAGSIITPQILELSGIGQPRVLKPLGIDVKVDLPVGENLQDHVYASVVYELKEGLSSRDSLSSLFSDPQAMEREMHIYRTQKTGILTTPCPAWSFMSWNNIATTEHQRYELSKIDQAPALIPHEQLSLLKETLQDPNRAQLELIHNSAFYSKTATRKPGVPYMTLMCSGMHPVSRGYVHIQSLDPHVDPLIDPRYLTHPRDLEILLEGLTFAEKVVNTDPMKSIIVASGGPNMQGDAATVRANLVNWIKTNASSGSHHVGTASMLPRTDGGVVDCQLKVYGTRNLRVVDASIIPMQISQHPQDTIYAIAEKAADLIKEGHKSAC